jgi:hypothetical protein
MRQDIFIQTSNVIEFRQRVRTLEDRENGETGFALIRGQAGRGKTETTRHYHAEFGGVFFRVMQDMTQAAFLSGLCERVRGIRPVGAARSKMAIIEALDSEPTTLFIDEADRLHINRIEDLRDIHDETGAPIVLIGESGLDNLLGERRRIWSRVKQVVDFGPVGEEDVAILADAAAGLEVGPEACARIVSASDGDFRLVWSLLGHLEQAARAKSVEHVDAAMVAGIAKKVVRWRR